MASSIRVFMYCTYFPPEFSGAAKQAVGLAKKLRKRGVDVAFMTARFPGTRGTETFEGFPVYRFRRFRSVPLGEILHWAALFLFLFRHRKEFDWIHSHGAYYTNSGLAWMARVLGKKSLLKVSLVRDDLAGLGLGWRGRLHQAFLRRADWLVAISREIAQEIEDRGFAPERIFRCPNGVDVTRFSTAGEETRSALRRDLGLPGDGVLFLYAGVVDSRKNVAWLVEQWVSHCASGGKGHLVVVGPISREDPGGILFHGLARRMADAGVGDRMTMREYVERIEDYYRACDVFVLPSKSEGMPNAVLEAMACGLPVIATSTSGTVDLLAEEQAGMLFEYGDGEALRKAVAFLAGGKVSRETMGMRARVRVERLFDQERLADRYVDLYTNLSAGESAGRTANDRAGERFGSSSAPRGLGAASR